MSGVYLWFFSLFVFPVFCLFGIEPLLYTMSATLHWEEHFIYRSCTLAIQNKCDIKPMILDKKARITIYYRGQHINKTKGIMPKCAIICFNNDSAKKAHKALKKYDLKNDIIRVNKHMHFNLQSYLNSVESKGINIFILPVLEPFMQLINLIHFDLIINWDHDIIQQQEQQYIASKYQYFQEIYKLMDNNILCLTPQHYADHLITPSIIDTMLYYHECKTTNIISQYWARTIGIMNLYTDIQDIVASFVGYEYNHLVEISNKSDLKNKIESIRSKVLSELDSKWMKSYLSIFHC